jgi:spore maturation protein CgeB
VYGDDYARALTGARIGIGFLRRSWPDQHTTRTFEIPACGSLLLADRTDEHREFFEEGKEAEFFGTEEELVDKAEYYSRKDADRLRLAGAGYQRCIRGKYSYIHRLHAVLSSLNLN